MHNTAQRMTVAFLCFVVASTAGCGGYGEVSPAAYEHAKALYSITNRKATDQLPRTREAIEAAQKAGDLPSHEAKWLTAIVDQAASGDWKQANQNCRTMMEDQVRAADR